MENKITIKKQIDDGSISDLNENLVSNSSYKEHRNSMIIFFIYGFLNYVMGTLLNSFSVLNFVLKKIYGLDSSFCATCTAILCFSFALSALPLTLFSISFGLRKSILLSILFFIVGNGLRFFIDKSYLFVYLGFFIIGLGFPLVYNSQLSLVNTWFHPKKRNMINALTSLFSPIGGGTAQLLPTFFLKTAEKDIINISNDVLRQGIMNLLIFYTIIFGIFLILIIIFLFDHPPEGYGEEKSNNTLIDNSNSKSRKFKKDLTTLIKDFNFIKSGIIYGLGLTVITILGVLIQDIIKPFGYTNVVGIVGSFLSVIAGLICAFSFSMFLQSKIKNKTAIFLFYIIGAIGIVFCLSGLSLFNTFLLYIGCMVIGGSIFSHISCLFEYNINYYSKINKFVINCLIVLFQQVSQTVLLYIFGKLLSAGTKENVYIGCSILIGFFLVCSVLSKILN